MTKKRRGRQSSREHSLAVNAALRYYNVPLQNVVKPARTRRTASSAVPLERTILAAIRKALAVHPRVAMVERNQSGVFMDGDRHVRVGSVGKLDLSVVLRTGQYGELEVKRPGGRMSNAQKQRLSRVRAAGGFAAMVTSVNEAIAAVEAV